MQSTDDSSTTRRDDASHSPSALHTPRSWPSASESTLVTFSLAASSASPMSSAAPSGSAAASTDEPPSSSLTVS